MLQQHRPAFRDGIVAEPAFFHRQIRGRVREVLGMARFVEQRPPVVRAADRLDHQHHLAGNLDWSAEGAGGLRRPLLEIEMDVLLSVQVDPEVGQGRFERRQHLVRREELVPDLRAEDAGHVPAPRFVEAEADPVAEQLVGRVLVHLLRRVEHRPALIGEVVEPIAETPVEIDVVRRA